MHEYIAQLRASGGPAGGWLNQDSKPNFKPTTEIASHTEIRTLPSIAGKALESTIKIICADKGWTTGAEKGASDFLNHLESNANRRFIEPWERQVVQAFFSGVRNDFGHGPGPAPMPILTDPQTGSAIELSMSCIKSLITRL